MKKIYRKISLLENRLLSLLMAAVMLLTSINLISLLSNVGGNPDPVAALAAELLDEGSTIRSDALHFYVRHWHTQEDTEARLNGSQAGQEENTKNYFVIAEGYIVPDKDTGKAPYKFYYVKQDGTDDDNLPDLVPSTEYETEYVSNVDETTGSITLNTKVLTNKNGSALENFSGFSISAGRDAVKYNDDAETPSITITYSPYVHLVKGHVFYVRASKVVSGSNDSVLGFTDEIDTAEVYTYKDAGETPEPHKAGEIVKYEGKACETWEEVKKAGVTNEDDVELTKFYSATAGLHTDNALLAQDADGRVYLIDLAAWYVQGVASQVGLILDASGGFAFAYDFPDPINVYDILTEEQANELLGSKIGGIQNELDRDYDYLYPQRESLIGYYETAKGANGGTERTWYFNSIDPKTKKYIGDPSKIATPSSYDKEYFAEAVYQSESNIDLSDSAPIITPDDYKNVRSIGNGSAWTWSSWASFSGSSTSLSLAGQASGDTGFKLSEASTPEGEFTLSFDAHLTSWPTGKDIEILYIGKEQSSREEAEFRLVRETSKNDALVLHYGSEQVTLIENFNPATKQTLTFTYDGKETVTFYVDGDISATVKGVTFESDEYIAFNPFADGVTLGGAETFNVDEILVYDVKLDVNEVAWLVSVHNDNQGAKVDNAGGFTWGNVFLTETQLALLLNTNKTDNSLNGYSGYSYFVYNATSGTQEITPLAYWDGADTDTKGYNKAIRTLGADGKVRAGRAYNLGGKGWYYMSAAGWQYASDGTTAKTMTGINNGGVFYDDTDGSKSGIKQGDATFNSGTPAYYDEDVYNWTKGKGADTETSYTSTAASPIKFYIDEKGNLRCFFNSSEKTNNLCSYVYELPDEKYVKTEAMQRILGNFATMLIDRSPATEVSAVRFSGDAATPDERKKLVLLDWSSDAKDIAGLMSMKYGDGAFDDHVQSERGVDQYNYVLTGSSYIHSALESFRENLSDYGKSDAAKFLIVITDGADSETSISESEADKLKKQGYTIISVMFGGTMFNENHPDYKGTFEHMTRIAGKDGMTYEEKGKYIFSSDNLEGLMDLFADEILKTIAAPLDNYTVKNYIDPRFNVAGSDGTAFTLGANGMVTIEKLGEASEDPIDVTQNNITVSLAGKDENEWPFLRYDAQADMYYLEWTGQSIPTGAEGAPILGVWNAQITLTAKDDFIGGNAVLTNGNGALMNYLYQKDDTDPSSGTDKMMVYDEEGEKIRDYPSKGFPRTTVNVQLKDLNTSTLNGIIYEGEVVSSAQLLTDIEDEYVTNTYYLEYLRRFAYQRYLYFSDPANKDKLGGADIEEELNMPLLDLLNKWLGLDFDNQQEGEGDDDTTQELKQFSVRYMYLPSVKYKEDGTIDLNNGAATLTNNAGNRVGGKFDMDSADVLGILTYRWQKLEKDDKGEYTPVDLGDKDYVANNTQKTAYSITVEFTPLQVGDTLDELNNKVAEKDAVAERSYEKYGTYMFAGRIIFRSLDAHKEAWTAEKNKALGIESEDFVFAREDIVNSYVKETDEDGKSVYAWDPDYRPALYDAVQPDSSNYKEGESSITFRNNKRTLVAQSRYELEVVSGGVALEMKLLIGELDNLFKESDTYTFAVKATREFTDTLWAQTLKTKQELDDYGADFEITFEISKTALDMTALNAAAVADRFGYVTVFAKATTIKGTFGKDKETGNPKPRSMNGLPIGTYTFTLDGANDATLNSEIKFASISNETDETKFDEKYFHTEVLDLEGNPKTYLQEPLTVQDFIAESKSDTETPAAIFYIGTTEETSPERGNVGYDIGKARYTDDRLGIVVLSTGTVRLIISEDGAQSKSNESFIYHITGTTLGYKDVDLIVSVKGGDSTTIAALPGTYKVTEISDWSWKYEVGEAKGVSGEWKIDESDKSIAEITMDSFSEPAEVRYSHDRNNMNWLGGESSENNQFSGATSEEVAGD